MNQASEQQKLSDLAAELTKLGANVTSRVPSDDLILRFQIAGGDDERIINELKGWGWSPTLTGSANHFDIRSYGTVPTNSNSLTIPVERAPVHEDGKAHFGPLSSGKKSAMDEADKILMAIKVK
jgi:hypothetical protein